jgi:membrane-bound lytic murein transglycosylase B
MHRFVIVLFCLTFIFTGLPAYGSQPEFSKWLEEFRRDAAARGITERTLEKALSGISPLPRVIELDRSQPEFVLTARQYIERVVSERRVEQGRQLYLEHCSLLTEIAEQFGVEAPFLVSLWGIESNFGRSTGGFRVVEALATLAWDGRRSAFFRGQLLAALEILEQEGIEPEAMTGSWAGAMGQMQFIPSTYRAYAIDFEGNGRRDIWGSTADALASGANYLGKSGWRPGLGWGQEVTLPKGFDPALAGLDKRKNLKEWRRLGIKAQGPDSQSASLLLPEGIDGPAFLVTENFRVLLQWNRSNSFAIAVGLLADRIAEKGVEGCPPSDKL